MSQIIAYGVVSTPEVEIDDKVGHAGGVPGPDQLREWIAQN